MKFTQLASSSTGNLYTLENRSGQRILIECGISWPDIREALDYELSNIEGCLISHFHADHSKAVRDVIKAGIDVYASLETHDELDTIENRRAKILRPNVWSQIEDFAILPFATTHDCLGSLGFIVDDSKHTMLFMTDSCKLDYSFKTKFQIVALECSYNKQWLLRKVDEGSIHETVAKRLLTSHMSETECLRTLHDFICLDKCTELHLIHCSADNINKERLKKEFVKEFMIEVIIL
ncbi:MAG TPA: MBL fold metallo-hydrolase [bacterium]|nr:MBL fold metallo-hydrolase [bacterium]